MPDANGKVAPSYASTEDTVTDNITKLVWQRKLPKSYAGCLGSNIDAPGIGCQWREGDTYCGDLVLAGFADWRLPTRIELQSIMDLTREPAIRTEVFPMRSAMGGADFWTAGAEQGGSQVAWYVHIVSGTPAQLQGPSLGTGATVRCVRGGSARLASEPRFAVNEESAIVDDLWTGLSWSRKDWPKMTKLDAERVCDALGFGWRLPGQQELLTLVEPLRASPVIDREAFPNAVDDVYWTASPSSASTGSWNTVTFERHPVLGATGMGLASSATEFHRARCVR